jgi:rod shape-determining protein MreD
MVARHAFPPGCTVLLMLTVRAPFGIAGQTALLPVATLACVYFWSLLRPAAIQPLVVFPIGLLFDVLGYLPLGTGPLVLLVVHGLAVRWRGWLNAQGFGVGWLAFGLFAGTAAVLSWLLASVLFFKLLPFAPALLQILLSIALYPALSMVFLRAHRMLAEPERGS